MVEGATGGGGGLSLIANTKVIDNTIEHNSAESLQAGIWGGGIWLLNQAPLPITYEWYILGNSIHYNKAISPTGTDDYDGGIGGGLGVMDAAKALIKFNDIRYNEVESNISISNECWGGGVVLRNQTNEMIFAENIVSNNKARNNSICRGAGIVIWQKDDQGSPQLIKNVIAHNTGSTYGGGLYIGGHVNNSASLINNTICDNSAVQGGAIYIGWDDQHVSHPEIENSILWNNGSSIFVNTGSVNVTYSDVEGGWSGTGNIDSDPLFADTLYHLNPGSPCIDGGNPSFTCNDSDGTRNDMGAYGGLTVTGLFERDNETGQLPIKHELSQNYPNPFNPTTTIKFTLPSMEVVNITLYNTLGQKVRTILNKSMKAGLHEVKFNAQNLASGVYYYKIEAGEFPLGALISLCLY
jgi:hypothetical protein